MCPSLIEIGSKTAEKNSAQTNRQTDTTKIMVIWPWTNRAPLLTQWPSSCATFTLVGYITVDVQTVLSGFSSGKTKVSLRIHFLEAEPRAYHVERVCCQSQTSLMTLDRLVNKQNVATHCYSSEWRPELLTIFMVALCNRADHYIFPCDSYLLFFFPRLISAVGDWMSTILPHMVWP